MSPYESYSKLSPVSRRLCHISWIYKAVERFIGTFVGISFYLDTHSLGIAMLYEVSKIVSINIGYSWGAFAYARFGWGSKQVFITSFVAGLLAFAAFFGIADPAVKSVVFGILYGICHGSYYLAYHWMMLRHTHDRDRDTYMTVYMTGTLTLDVFIPFVTTATLFVSGMIGLGDSFGPAALAMTLLSAAGILYSVFSFSDRVPLPIPKWQNFTAMVRHQNFPKTALFFGMLRMDATIGSVLLPLLGIMVLHSPINLGIATTVVTLITIFFVILSNKHRTPERRHAFAKFWFALEGGAMALGTLAILGGYLSLPAYLTCILVLPFAKAASSVVTQLYELRAADLIAPDHSGTGIESVVMRDTCIGVGRLIFLVIILLAYAAFPRTETLIVSGFVLWILALIGQALLIRSLDAPVAAVEAA